MNTYRPGFVPSDPAQLPGFLRAETQSIQKAANSKVPHIAMEILHAAPERVFAGMVLIADGTDWNPGAGAGMYRRNEANTAWVHLG